MIKSGQRPFSPPLWEAAIAVFICYCLELGAALLFASGPGLSFGEKLIATATIRSIQIIILLSLWKFRGRGAKELGLGREGLKAGFYYGAMATVFCAALAAGLELFFQLYYKASFLGRMASLGPTEAFGPLMLAAVFVGPLYEEFLFRVYLFGSMRKKLGLWPSLIITSAIFALLHYATGSLPLAQLAGGVIFSLAYEYSGSVMAPLLVHAAGNFAIYSLPFLLK